MRTLPFTTGKIAAGLSLVLLLPFLSPAQTAKADRTTALKNRIDSQRYIFHAQFVLPMSGRSHALTTDYTLTITPDKVISDLPYFGRAYVAPADPSKNSFQFTSTSFDYTATPRKKGGWDIQIKPKDNRTIQQMNLSITTDGYASLQVNSNDRQSIRYNGVITALQKH